MAKKKSVKYTTHEEDKELVISALAGNQRSYNTLLQKYKPILYTAAKRRLPWYGPEDLEDIVMFVLGNAFVKLNQYNPEKSKLFTWMIACLHNYVNSIPNQKKRVDLVSYTFQYDGDDKGVHDYSIPVIDAFDEEIDFKQSMTLLNMLMDKLPQPVYDVMKLKYWKGYSDQEIADELGIEKYNIYHRVQKGKKLLMKMSNDGKLFF
jgi:RNA polymerase sigma factor (sigma-70 family)